MNKTAPNSRCTECFCVDASHKAHINEKESTIGHHELRLVRLVDYISRLPLTIFRRNRTMISNCFTFSFCTLALFFNTHRQYFNISSIPNITFDKKDFFNLHTTLQSKDFVRKSTRPQTDKMAAVDETFSTPVRNLLSNKTYFVFHWLPCIM